MAMVMELKIGNANVTFYDDLIELSKEEAIVGLNELSVKMLRAANAHKLAEKEKELMERINKPEDER